MKKQGLLVILSGPSGAGKGTVLDCACKKDGNLRVSISATTRAPRTGEKHGEHYFFVPHDEFKSIADADGFLEWKAVHSDFYGTPKKCVLDWLENGLDVVLEIDVQGAAEVKAKMPQAITVFLTTPTRAELEKRLRARGTESEQAISLRLENAQTETNAAKNYDYLIINDSFADCADDFLSIVSAQKRKMKYNKKFIKEWLKAEE